MEILMCWIGSAIISYFIGITICKYYLTKLNCSWIKGLNELKQFTIDERNNQNE